MSNFNSQSPCCIGEMHIIILSKEELKQSIQICPYKSMSIGGLLKVYNAPNWKVENLKTKCDQEKC